MFVIKFDTKHDMLWTMFQVNNLWPLIIKFAQPLTQLTFCLNADTLTKQ